MDPGLARERTELAWTRTAIAFAAMGGAILRVTPALGLPVLATAALVWGIGRLSRRESRTPAHDPGRRLLLITIAVAFVSLVALAVVLLGGSTELIIR